MKKVLIIFSVLLSFGLADAQDWRNITYVKDMFKESLAALESYRTYEKNRFKIIERKENLFPAVKIITSPAGLKNFLLAVADHKDYRNAFEQTPSLVAGLIDQKPHIAGETRVYFSDDNSVIAFSDQVNKAMNLPELSFLTFGDAVEMYEDMTKVSPARDDYNGLYGECETKGNITTCIHPSVMTTPDGFVEYEERVHATEFRNNAEFLEFLAGLERDYVNVLNSYYLGLILRSPEEAQRIRYIAKVVRGFKYDVHAKVYRTGSDYIIELPKGLLDKLKDFTLDAYLKTPFSVAKN